MDKNMINIDDLFRQRLQGGEEKERAGAWANMNALLDKEMPVNTPAAFNFRRLAAYFAGGLMLAALSVGGYKGYETLHKDRNLLGDQNAHVVSVSNAKSLNSTGNRQANSNTASGNINRTAATTHQQNKLAANTGNNVTSHSTAITSTTQNSNTSSGNTTDNNTGNTQTAQKGSVANTGNTDRSNTDTQENLAAANNQTGHTTGVETIPALTGNAHHSYNTDNITSPAVPARNHTSGSTGQQYFAANTGNGASSSNTHTIDPAGTNNTAVNNRNNGTVPPSGSSNTPIMPAAAAGQQQKVPAGFMLVKDTLQKIRMVQHYVQDAVTHGKVLRVDTIAIEREIIDRLVRKENGEVLASNTNNERIAQHTAGTGNAEPKERKAQGNSGNNSEADNNQQPVVPNSASAADSKDLVPLDNYKVASKKSYAWDPERFREMVMRAKFNLGQVKFFPGITAGFNATMFGPNSMAGFQLGLSGVFALNDRWSVLTELKYLTRFNNGMSIKDNYTGAPVDSFATYNQQGTALEHMNYNRDSVEHYFNFSTVSSLELPIAVRYAINRLYLMGGVNFVYNFTVNAEEVSRNHDIITTLPYNHGPLNWPDGKPTITLNDFSSRFGIGYLLGAGYQITPAVNVDLRMTHTFWDNANGAGARKVSADLFKSPSMQLSIGYRFRQNRH